MSYLGRNIEKRIDPDSLFPDAKSVIVTGLNYYTDIKQGTNGVPVFPDMLMVLIIMMLLGKKLDNYYIYKKSDLKRKDSFCLIPHHFLKKPGQWKQVLGWQGRHSIVINKKIGSFFFIGIIVLNIELDYDESFKERSGAEIAGYVLTVPDRRYK